MLIFGWGGGSEKVCAHGDLGPCPVCGNHGSALVEFKKSFTLYFIPVGSYDVKYFVVCLFCRHNTEVGLDNFKNYLQTIQPLQMHHYGGGAANPALLQAGDTEYTPEQHAEALRKYILSEKARTSGTYTQRGSLARDYINYVSQTFLYCPFCGGLPDWSVFEGDLAGTHFRCGRCLGELRGKYNFFSSDIKKGLTVLNAGYYNLSEMRTGETLSAEEIRNKAAPSVAEKQALREFIESEAVRTEKQYKKKGGGANGYISYISRAFPVCPFCGGLPDWSVRDDDTKGTRFRCNHCLGELRGKYSHFKCAVKKELTIISAGYYSKGVFHAGETYAPEALKEAVICAETHLTDK